MNKQLGLSDAIYHVVSPQSLSIFESCHNPRDLVKHLSASELLLVSSLIGGKLEPHYTRPVEEIVYDTLGRPQCWIDQNEPYIFLKKSFDKISNTE
jgi:hypothetical protein